MSTRIEKRRFVPSAALILAVSSLALGSMPLFRHLTALFWAIAATFLVVAMVAAGQSYRQHVRKQYRGLKKR